MEDTLGVTRARLIFTFNAVLILVLMEDTLGGKFHLRKFR